MKIINTPQSILNKYFNFTSFRVNQESIINRLLNEQNGHSLVIMPTGAGKSLCYQIPAVCFEGGTIVISPLIALMQDQVDALKKKGIKAEFINSTVSKIDRDKRLNAFIKGKIKLLYVTPERFTKKDFIKGIRQANISLLAVDEAHCISAWGHDFRPDYSRLNEFRDIIGNPLTIALTATATREVQKDIIHRLGLTQKLMKIFHQGIRRPNLRLEAEDVIDDDEKIEKIIDVVQKTNGSGIVYFSLIKSLENFSDLLASHKIPHSIYHGRLNAKDRKILQNRFMNGSDKLILATNAFGMGIDKADIRFIIHAELPGSIESYYQEIGRAGRDGKDSLCLMLYNQNDIMIHLDFIKWSNPSPEFYEELYDLLKYESKNINLYGLEYLKEQLVYKNRIDFRLETALGMLERFNVVKMDPQTHKIALLSELPETVINEKLYDVILTEDAWSESTFAKTQGINQNEVQKASAHLNKQLEANASKINIPLKKCRIHSSDVFYRENFDEYKMIRDEYNCMAVEMEAYALFTNAIATGKNAACLLTVSDSLVSNETISSEQRQIAFTNMMKIALEMAE